MCADARVFNVIEQSHVFMFDKIFTPSTLDDIAELLVRSTNVKVVVTFNNCKNLVNSKAFKCVTQTSMCTTSRPPQNFQAYFLVRVS